MLDMSQALYVFATIIPKPAHVADVENALETLIKPTLEEAGCHLFSVFKNREEADVFHLFEIFKDDASIQAHYGQQYTIDVFAKYEKWLAEPPTVVKLSANSLLSAEQFV